MGQASSGSNETRLGRSAAGEDHQSRPENYPRSRQFPLNRGWLYSKSYTEHQATDIDADEADFERVALPHTNRVFPWHGFDDREYQFRSIYRRHLDIPHTLADSRLFVDFEGVMTAATVSLNGVRLGDHLGGYTPFSFELTDHVVFDDDNLLVVEVDSTERPDIPPFGGRVGFLTFGGIYREASLRAVPATFIADVFAKPIDVLSEPSLEITCSMDSRDAFDAAMELSVELRDSRQNSVQSARAYPVEAESSSVQLTMAKLGEVELWEPDQPTLYEVVVRLHHNGGILDALVTRVGFRDARFTADGFYLNGRRFLLRGLNRHQTYPYVGGAMPARAQRRDAEILKHELKCNMVRTSHYPQSRHFLDHCDEIGLLVLEEIPGWQHIGDEDWKALSYRNVEDMIRRDRNRPSIVLWGVRINESTDDHGFYRKTNSTAHSLDTSRPTGGVRNFLESELLEDVFTINDFSLERIAAPNHARYLVTEFGGHLLPTKRVDSMDRVQEHALMHARTLDMIAGDRRIAGGIGWCAFDYNQHASFGSGDRIDYHGVCDIFRIPKSAAAVYRSQCDPSDEIVLEPCFHWAPNERPISIDEGDLVIFSNCDRLEIYIGGRFLTEVTPAHRAFANLAHPPFVFHSDIFEGGHPWGDLHIKGYIAEGLVISRSFSGEGVDRRLHVEPDDHELLADGRDAVRVVLRVTDEYDAARPVATGAVQLNVEGPAEIVGENPFALVGGVGAVWLKAREQAGTVRLWATHAVLGQKQVDLVSKAVPREEI